MTTSNEELARNPHAPCGFRRRAERDPCYDSDRLLAGGLDGCGRCRTGDAMMLKTAAVRSHFLLSEEVS